MIIAFQGSLGAYSDLACRTVFPSATTLPCAAFEDAIAAVQEGRADAAMLPIENSIAGRVTDIHNLLPNSGLHIVGEHYQPVRHHLLALPQATIADIRGARSHIQALMQCRDYLRQRGIAAITRPDTAGSAEEIVQLGDPSVAAIASELAGQIYGLKSLAADIADRPNNTTRFLIVRKEPETMAIDEPAMTTLIFRVRSVPAALYKALGGFATNGINITKLESYCVDGKFTAAQFYVDVEGHPEAPAMRHALDELSFFAQEVRLLGTYKAHPFRRG